MCFRNGLIHAASLNFCGYDFLCHSTVFGFFLTVWLDSTLLCRHYIASGVRFVHFLLSADATRLMHLNVKYLLWLFKLVSASGRFSCTTVAGWRTKQPLALQSVVGTFDPARARGFEVVCGCFGIVHRSSFVSHVLSNRVCGLFVPYQLSSYRM